MTIIKLVKKAQKGDEKAFLKLFQEYERDLYRIAYVYVKNESDALDVVQEVAYRSFKNIKTLKNPEYFKTWLIKIAITCSIDVIRKGKKIVQINLEYGEFIGLEDKDITLSITLQELLDKLNEREKSTVILRFYEGYSFKEIAEILDIPLGTAKSVLYRALEKLKKEFKGVDRFE